MTLIRFKLLLFSLLILSITTIGKENRYKKIINKTKFKVYDSSIYNNLNINNQFTLVYFIYYNDHTYTKVTEYYYNMVEVGEYIKYE